MDKNSNSLCGTVLEEKSSKIFKEKGYEYEREIHEMDLIAFSRDSSTLFLIECTGHNSPDSSFVFQDKEDTKRWIERSGKNSIANSIPRTQETCFTLLDQLRYDDSQSSFYGNYCAQNPAYGRLGLSTDSEYPAFSRCCSNGDFFLGEKKKDGFFFKKLKKFIEHLSNPGLKKRIDQIIRDLKQRQKNSLPIEIAPIIILGSKLDIYAEADSRIENAKWIIYDIKDDNLNVENHAKIKYVFVVNVEYLADFIGMCN